MSGICGEGPRPADPFVCDHVIPSFRPSSRRSGLLTNPVEVPPSKPDFFARLIAGVARELTARPSVVCPPQSPGPAFRSDARAAERYASDCHWLCRRDLADRRRSMALANPARTSFRRSLLDRGLRTLRCASARECPLRRLDSTEGMTRHYRWPARDVQPPILIPQPCVDHVFPPLHWTAAAADGTLVGRERRFRPVTRYAAASSQSSSS